MSNGRNSHCEISHCSYNYRRKKNVAIFELCIDYNVWFIQVVDIKELPKRFTLISLSKDVEWRIDKCAAQPKRTPCTPNKPDCQVSAKRWSIKHARCFFCANRSFESRWMKNGEQFLFPWLVASLKRRESPNFDFLLFWRKFNCSSSIDANFEFKKRSLFIKIQKSFQNLEFVFKRSRFQKKSFPNLPILTFLSNAIDFFLLSFSSITNKSVIFKKWTQKFLPVMWWATLSSHWMKKCCCFFFFCHQILHTLHLIARIFPTWTVNWLHNYWKRC